MKIKKINAVLAIVSWILVSFIYLIPTVTATSTWTDSIKNNWDLILLIFCPFCIWALNSTKRDKSIDISSQNKYPANLLSNLHQCPFYFDGVYCATREGLLQAFKTKCGNEQVRLCGLSGREAQKVGQEYNNWKEEQFLYWDGMSYKRDSQEYWILLKRVFSSENMSLDVVAALLATYNRKLVHSIGKSDATDTVLTEQEFCLLMTNARSILKEKGLAYVG